MASSRKRHDDGEITVRGVLAYAAQLRQRADTAKLKDPHVELYRPSNDAARKVSQEHGPAEALRILATRARTAELRNEEADERGHESRARLVTHQLVARGERDVERARLTLGARLDAAMQVINLVSDVSAVQFDADRVSHGGAESAAPKSRRDRQRDDAVYDVRRAVERLEREAESTRRRLLEFEVAA